MTYKKTTHTPKLCLNCGEKVPGWRRFFCCDGCCSEYHQRGQKPRPIPTRPPGVCHCGCGKKLTGRQTRWHSDACRKKVKRDQQRAAEWRPSPEEVRELERKFLQEKLHRRPGLSGLWGDFPGKVRTGRLSVKFRCTQIIPHLGVYLPQYHLRNREFMLIYKDLLESVMNREVFGYVVEVTIE